MRCMDVEARCGSELFGCGLSSEIRNGRSAVFGWFPVGADPTKHVTLAMAAVLSPRLDPN